MKKLLAYMVMGILLISSVDLYAGRDKVGTAGAEFLRIPIGARYVALGGAAIAYATGADALYWNPAGSALAERPTVAFSYLNYVAGITSNYIAAAYPLEDIGTIGVSLTYLSYGDIEITTEANPNGTGSNYSPFDAAVGLSYARVMTDRVTVGITGKMVSQTIDKVDASGIAFDVGFTYNTGYRGLKFGVVMRNFGPKMQFRGEGLDKTATEQDIPGLDQNRGTDDGSGNQRLQVESQPYNMPASINFGVSIDLMRNEQHAVMATADQAINNFSSNRTNMGLEYGFNNLFFVRGGYTSTLASDNDIQVDGNGMGGFGAGFGLNYGLGETTMFNIDYGWQHFGILGNNHRFSVGLAF